MSNEIRALMQDVAKPARSGLSNTAFAVLIAAIVGVGAFLGLVLPNMTSAPEPAPVKLSQPPVPATFPTITRSMNAPSREERAARAEEWVKMASLPDGEKRFEQMKLYQHTTATLRSCTLLDSHRHLRRVHDAYRTRNHDRFLAWKGLRESHGDTMAKMQDMNQVELALSMASGAPQRAAMETFAEVDMMLSSGMPRSGVTSLECSEINSKVQMFELELDEIPEG